MGLWCVLALAAEVVGLASAATLHLPTGDVRDVRLLAYNAFMGPHDLPTGPLVRAPVSILTEPPDADECARLRGTVAYISHAEVKWRSGKTLEGCSFALDAQRCGAVLVVRRQTQARGVRSVLGFSYYFRDEACCKGRENELGVGLVAVWGDDFVPVEQEIQRGGDVFLTVEEVDDNPWMSGVFHNVLYIAFARVVFPMLDTVVVFFGLRALAIHVRASFHTAPQQTSVFHTMRRFIILSLVLLVVGSVVRIVYCAVCPFFSNGNLTVLQTHMLINLSVPLQLPAVLVASSIFRRVISVTNAVAPPKRRWTVASTAFCVVVGALELASAYMRGTAQDFDLVLLLSGVLSNAALFVASVVFLARGLPFLLQMQRVKQMRRLSSSANSHDPLRFIRIRFTQSIVCATFGLCVQMLAVGVMVGSHAVFFNPFRYGLLSLLYYSGFTVSTLFFVVAFAPTILGQRLTSLPGRPSNQAPAISPVVTLVQSVEMSSS